jgi:hypothetical protein
MIYRYQQRADRLIHESREPSRKRIFRRHLAQRKRLYSRAITTGDLRTALAVLDSEAKLCALFPKDQQEQRIADMERQLRELLAAMKGTPATTATTEGGTQCSA